MTLELVESRDFIVSELNKGQHQIGQDLFVGHYFGHVDRFFNKLGWGSVCTAKIGDSLVLLSNEFDYVRIVKIDGVWSVECESYNGVDGVVVDRLV